MLGAVHHSAAHAAAVRPFESHQHNNLIPVEASLPTAAVGPAAKQETNVQRTEV